jgi:ActR/RegA family two-component response regulator
VAANVISGRGIFFTCLDRALRSRGITVTCREHDLVTELTDARAVALAGVVDPAAVGTFGTTEPHAGRTTAGHAVKPREVHHDPSQASRTDRLTTIGGLQRIAVAVMALALPVLSLAARPAGAGDHMEGTP